MCWTSWCALDETYLWLKIRHKSHSGDEEVAGDNQTVSFGRGKLIICLMPYHKTMHYSAHPRYFSNCPTVTALQSGRHQPNHAHQHIQSKQYNNPCLQLSFPVSPIWLFYSKHSRNMHTCFLATITDIQHQERGKIISFTAPRTYSSFTGTEVEPKEIHCCIS